MPKLLPVGVVLLALGASAAAQSPYPHRSGAEKFQCRPTGLERFVGRQASQELGVEMMRSTGSKWLRWVPQGTAITKEFRKDRLTIFLDSQSRIERASCG